MKKPIFTALSPNTQADDIWLASKLLCMPWRLRKGAAPEKLRGELQNFLQIKSSKIFLFESGRTALHTLLQSLLLKKEDEVLLQAYTCVAVPEPILWVGAKPVYVDIEAETLTMSPEDLEKKITKQSKVLIIQHTFGQPAKIEELMAIAEKHNLFVIEDCAHSLGGEYEKQKLGTFGDASFFSFGRDKVISSVFGGALMVKDKTLAEKITNKEKECLFPSRLWTIQQLLHPIIISFGKATYRIYLGKIILKIARKLNLLSKAVYKEERQGLKPPFIGKKLPNSLAVLALHQFQKLATYNQHRQKISEIYARELKNLPLKLPPLQNHQPIYLRYTLQTPFAAKILQTAKKQEIHLGDWYTTGIAPEGVNYEKIVYNPATCPVAEKVAKQSINLPTGIQITTKEAQRIIQFLKNFYDTHTSTN